MFTFIARSQGEHILSTDNFALAERRAQKHANTKGRATVLTFKDGERFRVNHYSKAV
jgi:hypothetical protein